MFRIVTDIQENIKERTTLLRGNKVCFALIFPSNRI